MSVNINELSRFKDTLKQMSNIIKHPKKNAKISRIIEIAVDEIKKAYAGVVNVNVVVEEYKGGFTIYAKDKNSRNPVIAFNEFGTGFYAKGTYPGKLPTQLISFTSAKKTRSTKGWVYYYDNPDTKVTHGGIKGWMTPNGLFHTGQVANSTMYNACKKIVKRVRSEIE